MNFIGRLLHWGTGTQFVVCRLSRLLLLRGLVETLDRYLWIALVGSRGGCFSLVLE
jgi:hypothetical protein